MRLITRAVVLVERAIARIVVPLTLGLAFVLRRGRYSAWQRAQRRRPA